MVKPAPNTASSSGRRTFLGNAVKLIALAGLLAPLEEACKPKAKQPSTPDAKRKSTTHVTKKKKVRQKSLQEKLMVNTKTNIVHLPTSLTYVFYDEIRNPRELSLNGWENDVQGQVRLNRDKSGNILEVLALQKLRTDVNDDSLNSATITLARAFSKECANSKGINRNNKNYRLHELMLQLVALNGTVPASNKWQAFNQSVVKPQTLGKRQKWMENETAFNDRVRYIQDHDADYRKRLKDRATKYSLT